MTNATKTPDATPADLATRSHWIRALARIHADAPATERVYVQRERGTCYSYNAENGSDGTTPVAVQYDHTHAVSLHRGSWLRSTTDTSEAARFYVCDRNADGTPTPAHHDEVRMCEEARTNPRMYGAEAVMLDGMSRADLEPARRSR